MNEIRRLLLDAVPPLPDPPDRMGAVARRYRQRRRTAVAATALAVALLAAAAVGIPRLVTEASQPAGSATCPATTADRAGHEWLEAGRDRVPDEGAAEVIACDVPVTVDDATARPLGPPRVLVDGAAEVAAALDAVTPARSCTPMPSHSQAVFILRYTDRAPVFVALNLLCRVDESWDAPLRVFLTDFRDQRLAVTDPAAVPTPTCQEQLDYRQVVRASYTRPSWTTPLASGHLIGEPPVPVEPVATTLCRYDWSPDGNSFRLIRSVPTRGGLSELHAAINAAPASGPYCSFGEEPWLDVVKVVDRTGAAPTALLLFRAPGLNCANASDLVPTPDLLAAIDARLGPLR